MSVHPFPRRCSTVFASTTEARFATCTFSGSWSAHGICAGQQALIRIGEVRIGQIILFERESELVFALLIYRDAAGTIGVFDSFNELTYFQKDEYAIIGSVVKVYSGLKLVK